MAGSNNYKSGIQIFGWALRSTILFQIWCFFLCLASEQMHFRERQWAIGNNPRIAVKGRAHSAKRVAPCGLFCAAFIVANKRKNWRGSDTGGRQASCAQPLCSRQRARERREVVIQIMFSESVSAAGCDIVCAHTKSTRDPGRPLHWVGLTSSGK